MPISAIRKSALIVFAREPELGKVKTRLQSVYSAEDVLTLYQCFLKDVLMKAAQSSAEAKFLYTTKSNSNQFFHSYQNQFHLRNQRGADLGMRMYHAFREVYHQGFRSMVIIGTDCLLISSNDIDKAFKKLDHYDAVLGPANDGGYYLLGLNRPYKPLFQYIPWGTSGVLSASRKKLSMADKSLFLLSQKIDIDTHEDLQNCLKSPDFLEAAPNTAKALNIF